MVDGIPQPADYARFHEWLRALTDKNRHNHIPQVQIAKMLEVSPQLVTKWLNREKPGIPKAKHLKRLALMLGVRYLDLHQIAHDIAVADEEMFEVPEGLSPMAMRIAQHWEDLDDPGKTEILNLIETLLRMQRALKKKKIKVT